MLRPFIKKRLLNTKNTFLLGVALLVLAPTPSKSDLQTPNILSSIGCSDMFDLNAVLGNLSSFLDFSTNIGGCSLKTSGINVCQQKALDTATSIEKMWGEDYKYSYNACNTEALELIKTGRWKQLREDFALKQKGEFAISRTSKEVNPETGIITFAGGDTTIDTEEAIMKDVNYMSLFSTGAEEEFLAEASGSKEKSNCEKSDSVSAMGCDLKKGLNLHNGIARDRDKLIDDETQKISTMIDVSATPQYIIGYPTEKFVSKLPFSKQKDFRKAGKISMETEGMFRGKMSVINNHRKAMSNLMIFKSSIESTNTYPSISQKNAKNISAGDLP